jgi:hypothetical protein
MNMETHNRYFRDVNYNTDKSVKWDVKTGSFLSSGVSYLPEGIPNYMTGDQSGPIPLSTTFVSNSIVRSALLSI